MSSVLDHDHKEIALNNCECGAEPVYWSANGLAHEIICRKCGRQTDMETTGPDAVHDWNSGKIYRSAKECPLRSQFF